MELALDCCANNVHRVERVVTTTRRVQTASLGGCVRLTTGCTVGRGCTLGLLRCGSDQWAYSGYTQVLCKVTHGKNRWRRAPPDTTLI